MPLYENPLIQKANQKKKDDEKNLRAKPPKKVRQKQPSALEAAANALSLPGSSVRDVLAFRNPIDQWTTPFSDENRTSGRDLLRRYGLAGKDNSWGNFGAGLAVDIGTDPLTFVSGLGGLTKAGSLASKAGIVKNGTKLSDAVTATPRQLIQKADDVEAAQKAWAVAGGLDEHLDKPVKSILSLKLPMVKPLDLSGEAARPVANALASVSEKLMEIPGARQLRSAFDPTVLSTTSKLGQDIAEKRHGAIQEQLAKTGVEWAPLVDKPDEIKAASLIAKAKHMADDAGLDSAKLVGDNLSPRLLDAEHLVRAAGVGHATIELLGRAAKQGGEGVQLDNALASLRLDTAKARVNLKQYLGSDAPLSSFTISRELLDDAERMIKPFTNCEVKSTLREIAEKFTAVYKSNLTVPFPAFHVRNLLSGQIQNIVKGLADETQTGPMRYVRPLMDSMKLAQGKSISGLSKLPEWKPLGLTDSEATQMLKHEAYAHGILDASLLSDLGAATREPTGKLFSAAPEGTTWVQSMNPLLVAGGLADENKFLPARIGADVAQWTEQLNRLAPYVALRKSGVAPAEAARRVKAAQVDYGNITDWEKRWGKMIIPFYQFSKGMLEGTIDDLMKSPGGRTAITVKAGGRASQDNDTPRWLDGQTVIPLADERTLSAGGLMSNGAVNLLSKVAQGDTHGLAHEMATRLNPLIKHPLEMATGQSVFHGRPLNTIEPDAGATIQNIRELAGAEHKRPEPLVSGQVEHLLRSSPFSRYLSTANKLTKPNREAKTKIMDLVGVKIDEPKSSK